MQKMPVLFGLSAEKLLLTICCVLLVLLVLYVVILMKYINLNKKYNHFMSGANGRSLEESIGKRLDDIEALKEERTKVNGRLEVLEAKALCAYQKVALVKYDAFQEMGGKLSFTLCMLDGNEDGFLLTSMNSNREGCYIYIKEIIKGEAFVLLSKEEKQALEEAKAKSYS